MPRYASVLQAKKMKLQISLRSKVLFSMESGLNKFTFTSLPKESFLFGAGISVKVMHSKHVLYS